MTRFQRIKPCALVLVLLLIGCGASSKNGGATSSPSSNASSTTTVQRYSSDKADAWMHWSGMSMADVVNEDEARGVKLGGVGFLGPRSNDSTTALESEVRMLCVCDPLSNL